MDEEEPGPSTGRKLVVTSSSSPQSVGVEGKGRGADTIVAPEATPPAPLMCQVPVMTREGYTPYTAHFPTQPPAKYLLATRISEAVMQPRSDTKVTVAVHLFHHPGPAQRPASNSGASYYHTPRY